MPGGQHESRDKASSRGIEANDDKESDQKDTIKPSLRHTHTAPFLGSSDSKSFAPTFFKSARAPDTFKGKCNRRLSRSHRKPSPLVISFLPPHPCHVPGQHAALFGWPWRGFWGCWWVGLERRRGARHRVSTWPRDPRRRGQCLCTPSNKAQPAVVFSHSREACWRCAEVVGGSRWWTRSSWSEWQAGRLFSLLLLVGCLNVWPAERRADVLDCGNYPISGQ